MRGAHLMVVNTYEASVICDKTGMTLDELREQIDILIITASEKGSTIFAPTETIEIPAFAPRKIEDPTGAGDAYRAGLLVGIVNEWPLKLRRSRCLMRDLRAGICRFSKSQFYC